MTDRSALLVLESGSVFRGRGFGASGKRFGEVVFNTSITGYQEILSDPSYAGQIVVMTAPQIGNTGVNAEDVEASAPRCAGLAIRELSPVISSWRAQGDLHGYMVNHGLVGIEAIDTRALTRELREHGAQRGLVSTEPGDVDALIAEVRRSPAMTGRDLATEVSCRERYEWDAPGWRAPDLEACPEPPTRWHVVAYDFGIKHNILRQLRDAGCRVTVVPADTAAADALSLDPDGILLSNGPGDPAAVGAGIDAVRGLLDCGRVIFGICLGHQILSLALGAQTFKLTFGHHGGNHPVKDLSTGKVEITAQNHGFAVEAGSLPSDLEVTHVNLYDQTVEGIRHRHRPIFGIQYHPEASPGPHDAGYLFDRFVRALEQA